MKCPKCGYLGFDSTDRCRNCGYEFSLSRPEERAELPLRESDWSIVPDDLAIDRAGDDEAVVQIRDREATAPAKAALDAGAARRRSASRAPEGEDELPLFGHEPLEDDEPLIHTVSTPRAPLAVRRASPEVPRVRSIQPRTPSLDLAFDEDARATPLVNGMAPDEAPAGSAADPGSWSEAGMASRLVAAVLDIGLLAAIDLTVLYFTLQICGIGPGDVAVLPRVPLAAFFVVLNGGYMVAFTAGGQTLGKMVTGIRVVPVPGAALDFGHATIRSLVWLVLALPAGLGFLTAVFSRDHRGLHDRLASTRVVRAAA